MNSEAPQHDNQSLYHTPAYPFMKKMLEPQILPRRQRRLGFKYLRCTTPFSAVACSTSIWTPLRLSITSASLASPPSIRYACGHFNLGTTGATFGLNLNYRLHRQHSNAIPAMQLPPPYGLTSFPLTALKHALKSRFLRRLGERTRRTTAGPKSNVTERLRGLIVVWGMEKMAGSEGGG